MSASFDMSQNQLQPMPPSFDIQEFRCRSQDDDSSLDDFLPTIDMMSFCAQLSKQRSEKKRFTLIPSLFGVDGNSPPHVASWGYKSIIFPSSKECSSKGRRVDAAKTNRREEWRHDENCQRRGYSSPAFHCRSPPHQLYKLENSLSKLEQNSGAHYIVPGMNIQKTVLFQRSLSHKFLTSTEEGRKHNNTPVGSLEAPTLQVPLKKNVSMPDIKAVVQTCHGKKVRSESGQFILRKTSKNVTAKENLETSRPAAKCSLCISDRHKSKMNFIQAKKIDIKLPCLDTNQET